MELGALKQRKLTIPTLTIVFVTFFLIYSNTPVVLARSLGLPSAVTALVPMLLLLPIGHAVLVLGAAIRFPSALLAAAALVLVSAASALTSMRPHVAFEEVLSLALEGVLLALFVVNALRSRRAVLVAAQAMVLAGAVMGAIVIAQQLIGPSQTDLFGFARLDSDMSDGRGGVQFRLAGPIGEANRFAQVLAVLLPIGVALSATAQGARRLGYAFACVLIACGIGLTFSRGAIVALALATPFALALKMLRPVHLAGALAAAMVAIVAFPPLTERVVSIGRVLGQSAGLTAAGLRNADGAARGRLTEMKAAGLIFAEHPALGAGPGHARLLYPEYAVAAGGKVRPGPRRSHNLFLQVAAETGISGVGVLGLTLGLVLKGLLRARRRFQDSDRDLWWLASGVTLALVIFLTTSLFLHAAFIRYFWLLIGLCLSVACLGGRPPLAMLLGRLLEQSMRSAPSRS